MCRVLGHTPRGMHLFFNSTDISVAGSLTWPDKRSPLVVLFAVCATKPLPIHSSGSRLRKNVTRVLIPEANLAAVRPTAAIVFPSGLRPRVLSHGDLWVSAPAFPLVLFTGILPCPYLENYSYSSVVAIL